MKSVEIPTIPIVLGFYLTYLALGAVAEEKDSGSLVVTGNVFCDVCAEGRLSENGYGISGASVTVECIFNRKTLTVSVRGETDENGEFKMVLPSNIFQSADQLSKCSVKPLKSSNKSCRIRSKSRPSSLELQSFDNGVLTYSAGSFSYRPETIRAECNKKDFLRMMRGRGMAEVVQETSINPPVHFPWSHHHKSPPPPASNLSPDSPPGSPGLSPQPADSPYGTPGLSPQPADSPYGTPGFSPQPALSPYGSPGLSPQPADSPYGSPGLSPYGSPGLSPQPADSPYGSPGLSPDGSPGLSPQPADSTYGSPGLSPLPADSPYGSPGLSPLPADSPDGTSPPLPDSLLPPIPGGVPISPVGFAPVKIAVP